MSGLCVAYEISTLIRNFDSNLKFHLLTFLILPYPPSHCLEYMRKDVGWNIARRIRFARIFVTTLRDFKIKSGFGAACRPPKIRNGRSFSMIETKPPGYREVYET